VVAAPLTIRESQWGILWGLESFDKSSNKFRKKDDTFCETPMKIYVMPRYARFENDYTVRATASLDEVPTSSSEIICVEIKNLSPVAVKLFQIGFTRKGSRTRFMIPEPNTTDRKPFERSLHFGQAVTAYFDIQRITSNVDKAYVVTDHGEVCCGRSPVLDEIRWRTYDPFD
jgi:hypothetical protein